MVANTSMGLGYAAAVVNRTDAQRLHPSVETSVQQDVKF